MTLGGRFLAEDFSNAPVPLTESRELELVHRRTAGPAISLVGLSDGSINRASATGRNRSTRHMGRWRFTKIRKRSGARNRVTMRVSWAMSGRG